MQALEVVYGLVQNMKEVITRNKHGLTPLHLALQMEAADILLEQGASVLAQNDSRWTPLHMVSRRGHMEVARVFLEHDADVEARGEDGSAPLHLASLRAHAELAGMFLERCADVMVQDKDRSTPLPLASRWGRVEAIHNASRARRQRECPGRGRVDPHYIRRPFVATQK